MNFSEMTEKDLDSIFVMDEYNLDSSHFQVLGYDIEVKDTLIPYFWEMDELAYLAGSINFAKQMNQ